jgi:site-specific recombinase XerD
MSESRKSIQELFEKFIWECEYVQRLSKETIRGYRSSIELFLKTSPGTTLNDINTFVITRFFSIIETRQRVIGRGVLRSGIKKSTSAKYWSKLNCFFEWLCKLQYLQSNPFISLKYPTPSYEDRKFLSRADVEKIITAILMNPGNSIMLVKRNLVILYLLLFCGLRKGELLGLQIRDLDFERKLLTVRKESSKSGRSRIIPMHSQLIMYLKDYLTHRRGSTTQFLLVSNKGDIPFTDAGFKHLITNLNALSGIRFHAHQLRHTFAVNFLRSCNNVAKLKVLLGHSSINMTLVYLRSLPPTEMSSDIESMSIDSLY